MGAADRTDPLPLPPGRPRRVRSAVVHAVGMARAALTTSRGWAADSWDARLRLNAEIDRLRQEVGLLAEELRIKDARMSVGTREGEDPGFIVPRVGNGFKTQAGEAGHDFGGAFGCPSFDDESSRSPANDRDAM